MGFLRQESWSGLPFPPPGDLSNPGMEPESPVWQADANLPLAPPGNPIVGLLCVKHNVTAFTRVFSSGI